MRIGNALPNSGSNLLFLLAFFVFLGGCVHSNLNQALENIAMKPVVAGFDGLRREPLNARSHMDAALNYLSRSNGNQADIQLAKSGFQTAARLAPDLWEPLVGLAAAQYRLGEYNNALHSMAIAVEIRGETGPLALPLALVAFRANEPEFARLAFAQAYGTTGAGASFLSDAFSDAKIWVPRPKTPVIDVKTLSGEERNVVIEAFMIRDLRSSSHGGGLNLLDSLALHFGGSIVNLAYNKEGSDASGDISVTLPGVTYSLNLAARNLSEVSLEASPLVIARQGATSKFFEGGSVLIVPLGDQAEAIERDVGVILEVTPEQIGEDEVDLTVALELSNITGQSFGSAVDGANVIQTDKTRIEAAARVPYDKAIIVGSAGSLTRRLGSNNSIFAAPVPGLSKQNSSALRRDVLVLVAVRRSDSGGASKQSVNNLALRIFGQQVAKMSSYGRRPSDTPDPQIEQLLIATVP